MATIQSRTLQQAVDASIAAQRRVTEAARQAAEGTQPTTQPAPPAKPAPRRVK